MDQELVDIALIERYLKDELAPEERLKVEERLGSDPKFAADLAIQQEIYGGIQDYGDAQLMENFDKIHKDFVTKHHGNIGWAQRLMYLVGGVLFVGICILVITFTANKASEKLEDEPGATPIQVDSTAGIHHTDLIDTTVVKAPERSSSEELLDPTAPEETNVSTVTDNPEETDGEHFVDGLKILHAFDLPVTIAHTDHPPTYYFDREKLWLYGVDFELKNIDLRKHHDEIYLFHQNHYYLLDPSKGELPLEKVKDMRSLQTLGRATGKGPQVQILKPKVFLAKDSSDLVFHILEVEHLLDDKNNKYKFDGTELVITENLFNTLGNNFDVIYLEERQTYYLKVKRHYYQLQEGTHEFTELFREEDTEVLELFTTESTMREIRYLTLEDIQNQYSH